MARWESERILPVEIQAARADWKSAEVVVAKITSENWEERRTEGTRSKVIGIPED